MATKNKGLGCFGWSAVVFGALLVVGYFLPDTPNDEAAPSGEATSKTASAAESIAEKTKRISARNEERERKRKFYDAMAACQMAIEASAKWKVVKRPGVPEDHSNGDEFYFTWARGKIVFQNGYGAEVPTSAACIGSLSRCQIEMLSINGDDIISQPTTYNC